MTTKGALISLGVGAGLMYVLDPQLGRRRRAIARDKAVHAWNTTSGTVTKATQDLKNRTYGIGKGISYMVHKTEIVPDAVLDARIRSRMGHTVSHPGAIQVKAAEGMVELSGDILAEEMPDLITAIKRIPGVQEVENRLTAHESEEGVSALQGGRERGRGSWQSAPAARLLMGVAGGTLTLWGVMRKGATGALLSSAGATLLVRGIYSGKGEKLTA